MTEYHLLPGPLVCVICTHMQGVYPYEPHVPIHRNCDCTVQTVSDEDSAECVEEVREVKIEFTRYTDTREIAEGRVASPLPDDEDDSFALPLGEEVNAWDHDKLREAADWHPESGAVEIR